MTFLGKQCLHFDFDHGLAPAVTVEPGATVVIETMDACCGEVRSTADFLRRRTTTARSNPLTGPIFVRGAAPGDTLKVDIMDVELDRNGFQLVGPNRGIVLDEVADWRCHVFEVRDDNILFPNGIRLPTDPVVGTFGNAPAGPATFHANPLGGNLDAPAAKIGSHLYVPVEVPGALFSLGDVHACQGDGEIAGAPEIGARTTVRIELLNYRHSDWCMIEDTTHWHSICSASNEAESARLAVLQNARFLERTTTLDLSDALVLLTMIGRLSICRTGQWGGQYPVVSSSFPKREVEAALKGVLNARATQIE